MYARLCKFAAWVYARFRKNFICLILKRKGLDKVNFGQIKAKLALLGGWMCMRGGGLGVEVALRGAEAHLLLRATIC